MYVYVSSERLEFIRAWLKFEKLIVNLVENYPCLHAVKLTIFRRVSFVANVQRTSKQVVVLFVLCCVLRAVAGHQAWCAWYH